jgi:site-specific DNA-methyltransferase (adenine-specific)
MIPFPDRKYAVVYADPPWRTQVAGWNAEVGKDGGRHNPKDKYKFEVLDQPPYNTMTDDEIMAMPVKDIITDDALLFIWCIENRIPIITQLMETWGFRWGSVAFVWHKTGQVCLWKENAPFGPLPRRGCEFCFMGKRGKWIGRNVDVRQYLNSPRREHSRKPDEVRLRIDQLVGDVPKIELFARKRFTGWDAWGDETP